jgi:transmembrane sensor
MHDSIQIEEIAATWLARKDGEGWSAADQAALTAWLDASSAHHIAYIRLEVAWRQARRLKAVAQGALSYPNNDPGSALTGRDQHR